MEKEISLNPSDNELFDDIPESSQSPVIPPRQPVRTSSTIHVIRCSQPPSTGSSSTHLHPSPPHRSRGRSRARHLTGTPSSSRSGRSTASQGAWLAKADITSAFKGIPIHPDFWHLFGIQWKDAYYFAVRLNFGCKSSPKIFDSLSEALCWILLNKYRLPYIVHLLDDFLTVTPSSSPLSHGPQHIPGIPRHYSQLHFTPSIPAH